jgi:hypothetical protein
MKRQQRAGREKATEAGFVFPLNHQPHTVFSVPMNAERTVGEARNPNIVSG